MDLDRTGAASERAKSSTAGVESALIGLAFAFFSMAGCQCESRPSVIVALLLIWPAVVAAVVFRRSAGLAAAYLLTIGVVWRLGILLGFHGNNPAGVASDVLDVTREAVTVMLAGGNPYTHAFASSNPPGITGFAYPPGSLLYYLPAHLLGNIRVTEVFSAGLVLAGLAWAARLMRSDLPVALMGLYAGALPLVVLSTDNSNDTSAGALIFLAALLLLAARRRLDARLLVAAGLFMGWAATFKIYALAFWPFFMAYVAGQPWTVRTPGGRAVRAVWIYLAAGAGFAALVSLPFFGRSPAGFIESMILGPMDKNLKFGGWNIWSLLHAWPGWALDDGLSRHITALSAGLGLLSMVAGILIGVRRPVHAILFGTVVWFVTMFTARWTTYAYFAGIAPVALLIPLADRLAAPPREDDRRVSHA